MKFATFPLNETGIYPYARSLVIFVLSLGNALCGHIQAAPERPEAVPSLTPLYAFPNVPEALSNPSSVVEAPDGTLYVTAQYGGIDNCGGIISIHQDGETTVNHAFQGSDGANPQWGLVLAGDGNFYGVTPFGGESNLGTLFQISSSGVYTLLHSFNNAIDPETGAPLDAAIPYSPLVAGQDGYLYGLSANGGANGQGDVYRSTLQGEVTVLLDFEQTSLRGPLTLAQGQDGALYGTTAVGPLIPGANSAGAIFRLSLDGQFSILYPLHDSTEGSGPEILTQGLDGTFYGATSGMHGELFSISSAGEYKVLHSFQNNFLSPQPGDDGATVQSLTLAADGNLYGVNVGVDGRFPGHLFVYRFDSQSYASLYALTTMSGAGLTSLAFSASHGTIYGVAKTDGTNEKGTVLRIDALNAALPANEIATIGVQALTSSGAQAPSFRFTRTGGDLSQPLTVTVKLKGSAENGTDYSHVASTVTFKAAKASKRLSLIPKSPTPAGKAARVLIEPGAGYEAGAAFTAKVGF